MVPGNRRPDGRTGPDDDGNGSPDWEQRREKLVDSLSRQGRVTDDDVLEALRTVPRHVFVPEGKRKSAYADTHLPIGQGQTISGPHMVAIVADLLELRSGDEVLEVGTGCGYHAAVTAEVLGQGSVYSVEYDRSLAEGARERLTDLGYDISVRVGDGHEGWPEHAPFDRIYLTCAAPFIPDRLVEQLRPGGVIVAPVGTVTQTLVRAVQRADGRQEWEHHGGTRFVIMMGGASDS